MVSVNLMFVASLNPCSSQKSHQCSEGYLRSQRHKLISLRTCATYGTILYNFLATGYFWPVSSSTPSPSPSPVPSFGVLIFCEAADLSHSSFSWIFCLRYVYLLGEGGGRASVVCG